MKYTFWDKANFLIILCIWLKNQCFLEHSNKLDQYEKKTKGLLEYNPYIMNFINFFKVISRDMIIFIYFVIKTKKRITFLQPCP